MPVVELGEKDGTFDLPSVLIQIMNGPRRTFGVVLESVGVEPRAAHELPGRSVKLVAAAFQDHVHDAAGSVTILGVIGVALHLELLNGIHNRHIGNIVASSLTIIGGAVQEELILALATAVDGPF